MDVILIKLIQFIDLQECESRENYDWVDESQRKRQRVEKQTNEGKSNIEVEFKRVKFLKEEGISLAERNCPWQAIDRWNEALDIKIHGKNALDLEHEKIFDMKAQAFITLHEWEEAIEDAKKAVDLKPTWWCAYQTLGRAYLGFGKLKEAVQVR